jgi:PAS domain S-box-containing protein
MTTAKAGPGPSTAPGGTAGSGDDLFRLLVEGVRDYAIFRLDLEGRIRSWNPGGEHLKGYRSQEIMGRHFSVFYSADDVATGLPDRELVIATADGRFEGEGWRVRKDGTTFWANVVITPLYDDHQHQVGYAKVTRDITERRAADQALRQGRQELADVNDVLRRRAAELTEANDRARIAVREARHASLAKSTFLATMSHEIRTPMNAVMGMTGLLLDSDLDPVQRDYTETIRIGGDALLAVINDILDYSKIEAGAIELESAAFDVRRLVEGATELIAAEAAAKQLDVLVDVDAECPPALVGDETRIRRVLVNLLGNAVKFTSTGEVMVTVRVTESTGGPLMLRLSVSDTGIGIPEDRMDRVFRSFSQVESSTTRHYGGTGLGLAISSRLVEAMGGHIEVDSRVGQGSTFHFAIPTGHAVAETNPAVLDPDNTTTLPTQGRTPHILVVDDNPLNRKVAVLMLQKLKCHADVATDGREALAATHRSPYDIVFMDIQMPEMDGVDTTRAIRAELPVTQQPVIVAMTAAAMDDDRETCLNAGMDGYMSKPFRAQQLEDVLADWARAQRHGAR